MTEPLEPSDQETADLGELDGEHPDQQVRIARVNLLPAEVVVERRRRRILAVSLGLLSVYLIGLGGLYALKVGDVNAAREERDQTELQVALLRDELDSLSVYRELLDTVNNRETLLTVAMDGELSWARILGDLALSFDRQSSLTAIAAAATAPDALTGDATAPVAAEDGVFDLGDPVAQVDFTGYSIDRFAPGVEEVLAKFDDAEGFDDAYLATAGDEERGDQEVTAFNGLVQLNERAYTHRFDDGLPKETVQ